MYVCTYIYIGGGSLTKDPRRRSDHRWCHRLGSAWQSCRFCSCRCTIVYWGSSGIMEKKMETTILYWGNIGMVCWGSIGILEKKMETIIVYQGIYWGLYRDNGKENGNYRG